MATYDQVRFGIRCCVEDAKSIDDAQARLKKIGVNVKSIIVVSKTTERPLRLKDGTPVALHAEAFVPQEFVSDAGASSMIPAGVKEFKF